MSRGKLLLFFVKSVRKRFPAGNFFWYLSQFTVDLVTFVKNNKILEKMGTVVR